MAARARPMNHLFASKPGTIPRKVLITGVNDGRGRSLAVEMAKRGHIVIGCDRSDNDFESLRMSLNTVTRLPPDSHFIMRVDVRSDEEVRNFAREVMKREMCPDIIVNNAGIMNQAKGFLDISAQDFDEVINTNVKGTANILRHFIPPMARREHGVIVNFSTSEEAIHHLPPIKLSDREVPAVTPYMASESAVKGLTASVRKDLPAGLSIHCLETGLTNTELLRSRMGRKAAQWHGTSNAWAKGTASRILAL